MEKIPTYQPQSDDPIFVEIHISGKANWEEKISALKKMLSRCHPVAENNEVYFLEKYQVIEDL